MRKDASGRWRRWLRWDLSARAPVEPWPRRGSLRSLNTHGRIGLVACAATFSPGRRAGGQRPDAPGRPGLNPQRFDTLYVVDQEHMDAMQRIAERTGAERQRQRRIWMGFEHPRKREGEFVFAERSFIVGKEFAWPGAA